MYILYDKYGSKSFKTFKDSIKYMENKYKIKFTHVYNGKICFRTSINTTSSVKFKFVYNKEVKNVL